MDEPFYSRRPNILPQSISNGFLFLFLSFMIPATYWYELWVVLPYIFSNYPFVYWSFFILGHFILHNVVGNLLALIVFDTSIRGRKMPSEKEPGVQYCTVCATYTPPRSFHCPSCDICILKRDHHCEFTGCCIGFYNHRFFICFIFYISLSTLLSLPFNIYFLCSLVKFSELMNCIGLLCPFLMFVIDLGAYNVEMKHAYIIITLVNIYGALFSSVWLHYHLKLIFKGTVAYEMKKSINHYNLGSKKNFELVFGKKGYLTFLSPYIKSALICDGIKFPIHEKNKCH